MNLTRKDFLKLTGLTALAAFIDPKKLYANPGAIIDSFSDGIFDKKDKFTEKGYSLFEAPVTLTIGENGNIDEVSEQGKLKLSTPPDPLWIDIFTAEYSGDMILTSKWDYVSPAFNDFYGIQIGNNIEPRSSRNFARVYVTLDSPSPEIIFRDETGQLGSRLAVTASSSLEFRLTKSATNVVTAEVNQDNNGFQQVGTSSLVPSDTSGMIATKIASINKYITTYFKLEGTNIPDILDLYAINKFGIIALALSIPLLYKRIKEKKI